MTNNIYDMMFGVICSRSCCARDYHQMLRRVRKIEDQNILIFNYSNFQLNDNVPHTTYEETKKYCLKVKDINLKRQYERNELTTKIVYIVDDYDQIYIYNKAEERNSHSDVFLTTFLAMADQKGFEYEIEAPHRDERSNTMDNKAHRINWKIEELLSAKDISHEEAEVLQMKANRLEDTQDEKIQLDRYYIELKLGVDSLDEGILKHFQYGLHTIMYFSGLIDERNIPRATDNHFDELQYKIPIVRELLDKLGFDMFNGNIKYSREEFSGKINALRNTNIFKHDDVNYKMFSTSKELLDKMFVESISLKSKLGYINSVLSDFSLKTESFQLRENKGNKSNYYRLSQVGNITEIIENRMNRGLQLYDIRQIYRKPDKHIYNHLIKT